MYELPNDMPNNLRLRILESKEILRKFRKYLKLMVGTQPATTKLQTISSNTFHWETNFTWFREFVYNILFKFVVTQNETFAFHFRVSNSRWNSLLFNFEL